MRKTELIGQSCCNCDLVISALDLEARFFGREEAGPDGEPVMVDDLTLPVCSDGCYEEVQDGEHSAAADAMERGLDYAE